LKVLGNIQADLHSRQLEVGKEAVIQGAIAAETVDVFGRVNGAIMGTHVVLHAGAEVEGDIHSHLLSIEQGAAFDGRSRRVRDPAEIAPQLERTGTPAQASYYEPERAAGVPPTVPTHMRPPTG
jgi:cytoskeletal protein CcmA (bactofilin family)